MKKQEKDNMYLITYVMNTELFVRTQSIDIFHIIIDEQTGITLTQY